MSRTLAARAGWPSAVPFALLLLASACGETVTSPEPEAHSKEPVRGGTLVVGSGTGIAGVNEVAIPSTENSDEILFQLFLHLLEEQPGFGDTPPAFEPLLAESYEWSEDRKALTFHLRDGVFWSDGQQVTAEDVRWTWQAQVDDNVAWDGAYIKRKIVDVEVVDPLTARFHFSEVYANQLHDANEGVILPKHAWSVQPFSRWRESSVWFREHLVTDGPFKLKSWTPQQEVVLERNEHFFIEGLPYLDQVVIREVPDQANRVTQVLSGSLDYALGISPEDASRVEAATNARLVSYWHRLFVFISWNTRSPLFRDVRVRQALTMAIDRQGIVDTLWREYAREGISPVVTAFWAHNNSLEPWPFDPARARALLAEAGWEDTDGDGLLERDGLRFSFELLTHSGNRQREDALVMIHDQLAKVGIDARPRLLDFHTLVDLINQQEVDAFLSGIGMPTNLDQTYLLHSSSIDGGMNYASYSNPEVDQLIDEALHQPDLVDVKPYLDEIQRIVHEEQPLTFLWESKRLGAMSARVRGAEPNMLFDLNRLREWWVEPKP